MATIHPRRFAIVAAPGATAWLQVALERAFGPPQHLPDGLNRLADRLQQAR